MTKIRCTTEEFYLLQALPTETYLTSKELASRLACSDRTVRSRIRQLEALLEKVAAGDLALEAKPGHGYRLLEFHRRSKEKVLERLRGTSHRLPSTPGDRTSYLLSSLLTQEGYQTISQFAEELYVSDSVVKTALRNTEAVLKRYGIHLERRPGYGLRTLGEEASIRNCLVDLYSSDTWDIQPLTPLFGREDLELLKKRLLPIFTRAEVYLPEVSFVNFLRYLLISMNRLLLGRPIQLQKGQNFHFDEALRQLIAEIARQLEEDFHLHLPEEEKIYLAILLSGKRILSSRSEGNFVVNAESDSLAKEMLEAVYEEYGLELRKDLQLYLLLAQHLQPLAVRLRFSIPQTNPILADIQCNYPQAYEMARFSGRILEEHFGRELPEAEIGYLAVIFQLALEQRRKQRVRFHLAVVCALGKGSSQLLAYKCRQVFGEYIASITVCSPLELAKLDFSHIDYVLATVPISVPVPVPIFEVDLFFTGTEVEQLRSVFDGGSHGFLRSYFRADLDFRGLQGDTKEAVLAEMVERAKACVEIPDRFLPSVLQRESLSSTDYGNAIAIAHPMEALLEETVVMVGFLEKPVFWGREEVDLVLLFGFGRKNDPNQALFCEQMSQWLLDPWVMKTLRKSQTLLQFFQEMEEHERTGG